MMPSRIAIPWTQPPVLSSGLMEGSIGVWAVAAPAERTMRTGASTIARKALIRRDSPNPLAPFATPRCGPRGLREPEMGFEPMTYHLRGGCSTTELLRRTKQDTTGPGRDGCGCHHLVSTGLPRWLASAGGAMMRRDGDHRDRPHRPRPPRDGGH